MATLWPRLCAYTCASQKTTDVTTTKTAIGPRSSGYAFGTRNEDCQDEDRPVDEPAEPLADRRAAETRSRRTLSSSELYAGTTRGRIRT